MSKQILYNSKDEELIEEMIDNNEIPAFVGTSDGTRYIQFNFSENAIEEEPPPPYFAIVDDFVFDLFIKSIPKAEHTSDGCVLISKRQINSVKMQLDITQLAVFSALFNCLKDINNLEVKDFQEKLAENYTITQILKKTIANIENSFACNILTMFTQSYDYVLIDNFLQTLNQILNEMTDDDMVVYRVIE